MQEASTTSESADRRYTRRATGLIITHYLLSYLGYYGLLSTLAVALSAASFDAGQIAALVMVFALTNKVANIPLAPWLGRLPTTVSVLIGCVMAGAGFTGLRFATGMPMTVLCLGFAGVGISINALGLKTLGAAVSDRLENRSRLFALISVSINIAAATAAPVALFFVERKHHGDVLLAVAALYVLAGLVTFANRVRFPDAERVTRSWSLGLYLAVLRRPGLRAFFAVNFFFWIMYGQLFNALALYVSETLHEPAALGSLYTVNALMVVALQLVVTRLAGRWLKGRHLTTVVAAYGLFAVAFAAVYLVPGFGGAIVFVVLFTVAEMLFMPSGDVVIVRVIGEQNRAVGYSIFAISTALGEALGSGTGVAAQRWLTDNGHGTLFWLAAAALAAVFALITHRLHRASPALSALT
ncbi:MFS transporter [Amycolatopsis sp. CA-128772]|uniref:MFS transporter n=1 Tax=Amycolatopsis sp. CA-128772 TaxID=2073159 RepID=UPI000CD2E701|nr:MFS transporter [Amycolatopsis sp. CA-128772]